MAEASAMSRKRITILRNITNVDDADLCSTSSAVEVGRFAVYTGDQKRFVLPLEYLNNEIFRELFKLAEEEFGLLGNRPLTLPCDAVFMKYVVDLIQRHVAKDGEKALLTSVASSHCSSSLHLHQDFTSCQLLVCSF